MSVCFNRIHGNQNLKSYFSQAITGEAMPHALILEGQNGSGRYTFALELAMSMCCKAQEKPCGICNNCRKFKEGISPDVVTVTLPEGKASIPVDAVRDIKSSASKVPIENDYKFYIIRNCEKMTVQAQNAILKVLEEPPSFIVFILITTSASLLLPTIVSRAPVFRMQSFTAEELTDILLNNYQKAQKLNADDPEGFSYLVRAANGCLGQVIENLDKRSVGNTTKRYQLIEDFFCALIGNDKYSFISLEEEINSKKREEFVSFVSDIRIALRDVLCVKKSTQAQLLFFISEEKAIAFASMLTLESIVNMIGFCNEALKNNELNANMNLLKINFMSGMWKRAHS
ncbi:MAG: hypothetical protein IKU52_04970 [Clostridia bacterium]|nr:hypothetical protein [Clostridia bacterium]